MNTQQQHSLTINFNEDSTLEDRIYNFLDNINVHMADPSEKENSFYS